MTTSAVTNINCGGLSSAAPTTTVVSGMMGDIWMDVLPEEVAWHMLRGTGDVPVWSFYNRYWETDEIIEFIRNHIPKHWQLLPVSNKVPTRTDWQNERLTQHQVIELLDRGEPKVSKKGNNFQAYHSGFGIITGEQSQGLIAVDVDGLTAQPILDAISQGDLPETVSWTSGKPGRKQLLYQFPVEVQERIKGFTRRVYKEWGENKTENGELLELRYNTSQSVLPPSRHPDTGSYRWINSPQDYEVAIAPQWLIDLAIEAHEKNVIDTQLKREQAELAQLNYQARRGDGEATNLVDFLNYEVLPLLKPEQIYCWSGHNWKVITRDGMKGTPPWRQSASGTGFSVFWNGQAWLWKDFGDEISGGAVKYRWMLKGGEGTPKGRDFVEIVKELADEAGLEMPEFKPAASNAEAQTEAQTETYEQKTERIQAELSGLGIRPTDKVIEIDAVYFSEEHIHLLPENGLCVISNTPDSGKGTNRRKTSMLAKAVQTRFKNRPVIGFSPTNILCRETAAKFGDDFLIRDDCRDSEDLESFKKAKKGLLCPESYKHLEGRKFENHILNFDEANPIIENLRIGNNGKQYRSQNLMVFNESIKDCVARNNLVIISDGNANKIITDRFRAANPDTPVTYLLVNKKHENLPKFKFYISHLDKYTNVDELKPSDYDPNICGSGDNKAFAAFLNDEIFAKLDNGKKLVIPCDSLNTSIGLEQLIRERYPKLKIRNINSEENRQDPQVKKFVADINKNIAVEQLDVFIFTPTIPAGASIILTKEMADLYKALETADAKTEPVLKALLEQQLNGGWETGESYFGLATIINTHLSPDKIAQMGERPRHAIERAVYVGRDVNRLPFTCRSHDPAVHLNQLLTDVTERNRLFQEAGVTLKDENGDIISLLEQAQRVTDIAKDIQSIIDDLKAGKEPTSNRADDLLWARLCAREAYLAKNRLKHLVDKVSRDGHEVEFVRFDETKKLEIDESSRQALKEQKDRKLTEESNQVVLAPIVSAATKESIKADSAPLFHEGMNQQQLELVSDFIFKIDTVKAMYEPQIKDVAHIDGFSIEQGQEIKKIKDEKILLERMNDRQEVNKFFKRHDAIMGRFYFEEKFPKFIDELIAFLQQNVCSPEQSVKHTTVTYRELEHTQSDLHLYQVKTLHEYAVWSGVRLPELKKPANGFFIKDDEEFYNWYNSNEAVFQIKKWMVERDANAFYRKIHKAPQGYEILNEYKSKAGFFKFIQDIKLLEFFNQNALNGRIFRLTDKDVLDYFDFLRDKKNNFGRRFSTYFQEKVPLPSKLEKRNKQGKLTGIAFLNKLLERFGLKLNALGREKETKVQFKLLFLDWSPLAGGDNNEAASTHSIIRDTLVHCLDKDLLQLIRHKWEMMNECPIEATVEPESSSDAIAPTASPEPESPRPQYEQASLELKFEQEVAKREPKFPKREAAIAVAEPETATQTIKLPAVGNIVQTDALAPQQITESCPVGKQVPGAEVEATAAAPTPAVEVVDPDTSAIAPATTPTTQTAPTPTADSAEVAPTEPEEMTAEDWLWMPKTTPVEVQFQGAWVSANLVEAVNDGFGFMAKVDTNGLYMISKVLSHKEIRLSTLPQEPSTIAVKTTNNTLITSDAIALSVEVEVVTPEAALAESAPTVEAEVAEAQAAIAPVQVAQHEKVTELQQRIISNWHAAELPKIVREADIKILVTAVYAWGQEQGDWLMQYRVVDESIEIGAKVLTPKGLGVVTAQSGTKWMVQDLGGFALHRVAPQDLRVIQ